MTSPQSVSQSRPDNEQDRLESLRRLDLLDTPPEPAFDRIVQLAARLLDAPIALITLVDEHRQWFKARVGLDVDETPREVAFCSHAIAIDDDGPLIVADASKDPLFFDNALVTGEPFIRFYAGQPIRTVDGHRIGTLCVIDRRPRQLDQGSQDLLRSLAVLVEDLLHRQHLAQSITALRTVADREALLRETMHDGMVIHDRNGTITEWNAAAEGVLGLTGAELGGRTPLNPNWRSVHEDGTPWPGDTHPAVESIRTGRPVNNAIMGIHRPGRGLGWIRVNSTPMRDAQGATIGALVAFTDITAVLDAAQASQQPSQISGLANEEREDLRDAVEKYRAVMDESIETLQNERLELDGLLIEIAKRGDLLAFMAASPTAGQLNILTKKITSLEEARSRMRYHLFKALQAHGATTAEIAKIWNISRQLTARVLQTGHDDRSR